MNNTPLLSSLRSLVSDYPLSSKIRRFPIFDSADGVFTGQFISVPTYSVSSLIPVLTFDGTFHLYSYSSYSESSYFVVKYKDVYAVCSSLSGCNSPLHSPFSSIIYDSSVYINGFRNPPDSSNIEYCSVDSSLNSAFSFIFDCIYSNLFENVGFRRYLSYFTKTSSVYPTKAPNFRWLYDSFNFYCFVDGFTCCQPDFAPIVKTLGGTPLEDQNDNLKLICQLLGIDTSENGLTDCDLMKDYLKRLVSFFGCSPSDEPNDNLKSICQFLGVDTSENDLKDCDLSKDYVKKTSEMLGGTNA